MKKIQRVILTGAAGMFLMPVGVSAAETTADVTFIDGESQPTVFVKPGTSENIISPNDGVKGTTGALRINWVPNIRFGSAAINVASTSYSSLITTYDDLDDAGSGTVNAANQHIPQFVQVSDTRGTTNGDGYTLKATASVFTEAGGSHKLNNTRIQFYSCRVTNSSLDKAASGGADAAIANTVIAGIPTETIAPVTGAINQLTPSQEVQIVRTVQRGITDASATSVVFDGSYTSNKDYSTAAYNDQVKLFVPSGEGVKKTTYQSTLTWTLSQEF